MSITKKKLVMFPRNERGNVAMMFGLMAVPMFSLMGLAIDAGRAYSYHGRLQRATDAAAMAALRTKGEWQTRHELAVSVFRSNMSPDNPSAAPSPEITLGENGAVTVTAQATVETTILTLIGEGATTVGAKSVAASSAGRKLEVGMMIDLTGSMAWNDSAGRPKIEGLREAGLDLMNILYPNGDNGLVKVGIAPMSTYVNAGPYAAAATGLSPTGSYANRSNLSSTRNGPFSGAYSGTTSNAAGSTAGATGSGTGDYSSTHCSNPNAPVVNVDQLQYNGYYGTKNMGVRISQYGSGSVTVPSEIRSASGGVYRTNYYDNEGSNTGWRYVSGDDEGNPSHTSSGYYVPLPADVSNIVWRKDSNNKLLGIPVSIEGNDIAVPPQFKKASDVGGYRKVAGYTNNGYAVYTSLEYNGYFAPIPTNMTSGGGVLPQCTEAADQSGQLITCVTERRGANQTTDVGPGVEVVGAYNASPNGATNKLNYSSDGKCYVAGREMPSVIAMTSTKSTLTDFFSNKMTVGGGTPGHLGHAWAWYLVSPEWNSVFGSSASEYGDEGTMKAVVLMTDGEYNMQYTSTSAREQAEALCTNMKAKGIKVFTVGFGFSATALPGSADHNARQLLTSCSSGENHYYFPYDSASIKAAFKAIGDTLVEGEAAETLKITH